MTSLTALGLPYQQATDRPCDAPTTWCNFVSVAETQLVAIDTILGRVSPAVPAAKVRRSTPLTITGSANFGVPFESAAYDTDNMVNLANSPAILPRRLGRYVLTLVVQNITTSFSNNNVTWINITTGPVITEPITTSTTFNSAGFGWAETVNLSTGIVLNDNWFKASVIADWTINDSQGWGVLISPTQTGVLGICELSAHWVSDLHI